MEFNLKKIIVGALFVLGVLIVAKFVLGKIPGGATVKNLAGLS